MLGAISLLDSVIGVLRSGFIGMLTVATALATLSWAVRTRRLSPFSSLSRFARLRLDPLIAPVERRIVRAGNSSSSAPWWALLLLLVAVVGVLFVLGFARDALLTTYRATTQGTRGLVGLLVSWGFGALQLAIIVRVVTSWIGGTYSAVGRLAIGMTEWFLAPLRRLLPPFGMVDLSPLVAWFLIILLRSAVLSLL